MELPKAGRTEIPDRLTSRFPPNLLFRHIDLEPPRVFQRPSDISFSLLSWVLSLLFRTQRVRGGSRGGGGPFRPPHGYYEGVRGRSPWS